MAEAELYLLRWKGRQLGPFSKVVIQEKLSVGELSLLHEIKVGDQWTTLGNFLSPAQNQATVAPPIASTLPTAPTIVSDPSSQKPPLIAAYAQPAAAEPEEKDRTIGWIVMILLGMIAALVALVVLLTRPSPVVPPIIPPTRAMIKATNNAPVIVQKEPDVVVPETNSIQPPPVKLEEPILVAPVKAPVEKSLTLQPGPGTGHNVYVAKLAHQPSNTPSDNEAQLAINVWTVNGQPLTTRSYLKFTQLTEIPVSAKVISANLYLFGIAKSSVVPQGNSCYPGSPYNKYTVENRCVVERVVGRNWDESTLTFDDQPASTTNGQAIMPSSTSQWNFDTVVDVSTQVQAMVAEPSKNFGFVIKMQTEQLYRSVNFASAEVRNPTVRPKLVVVYQ